MDAAEILRKRETKAKAKIEAMLPTLTNKWQGGMSPCSTKLGLSGKAEDMSDPSEFVTIRTDNPDNTVAPLYCVGRSFFPLMLATGKDPSSATSLSDTVMDFLTKQEYTVGSYPETLATLLSPDPVSLNEFEYYKAWCMRYTGISDQVRICMINYLLKHLSTALVDVDPAMLTGDALVITVGRSIQDVDSLSTYTVG